MIVNPIISPYICYMYLTCLFIHSFTVMWVKELQGHKIRLMIWQQVLAPSIVALESACSNIGRGRLLKVARGWRNIIMNFNFPIEIHYKIFHNPLWHLSSRWWPADNSHISHGHRGLCQLNSVIFSIIPFTCCTHFTFILFCLLFNLVLRLIITQIFVWLLFFVFVMISM